MNKKATAIQQAIAMVKNRIDSLDETLMGKHTIHHLQQVERGLYELLEKEKEQIIKAYNSAIPFKFGEQYYNETYKQ
jgi:DNA-binding FrmR family transcriptional regulator